MTPSGQGEQLIAGKWLEGSGPAFSSKSPATGQTVWAGVAATASDVAAAIAAARSAQAAWGDRPPEARIAILEACARELTVNGGPLADAIGLETGKPRWEVREELSSMVGKVAATIDAWRERQQDRVVPLPAAGPGDVAAVRYRPHGVLAVLGPFNFPGHIPHGHIVPALLAGNAVVFKPSEFTPLSGRRLAEIWERAGLPAGVLNLVQGGRETGATLAAHPGHDGILFTGSYQTGVALRRMWVEEPGKMLALELGGNNPLVVHAASDLDAAATLTILSAFLTAGQRCSCARRLIVPEGAGGNAFIARLLARIDGIRVGLPHDSHDSPEPFMGPVIHEAAARSLLAAQDDLLARGGIVLRRMAPQRGIATLLSPGLVDVTAVCNRPDTEWFGPLLQLVRVPDFEAAIAEANRTAYGLAAGLVCDERSLYDAFRRRVRAGVVTWNRQTTGASPRLPFGGIGRSGNHRPSGYFAIDYCGYPVASLERDRVTAPPAPPGLE
jgi:succinylglutamic semialdehyde dehydrogenase